MTSEAIATVEHYASLHAQGQVPDYEGLLEQAYTKLIKAGDTVFDIGAHGGRHARPFTQLIGETGRLVCFEPLPTHAAWLRQSMGNHPNVEIRQKALSRQSGNMEFLHVRNAPEESGLRERLYNIPDPDIERMNVDVSTLDHEAAVLKRLDYIKIDVEGAEIDCLEGGRETLRRFRPIVSVEYGCPAYSRYGSAWSTLFDLAQSLDLRMGDLFGNLIASREEWHAICDKAYWDYFMVPVEKSDVWQAALKGWPAPKPVGLLGRIRQLIS